MSKSLQPRLSRLPFVIAPIVAAALLQACGGGADDGGDSNPAEPTLAECFGVQARVTPGVTMAYALRSTAFDAQGGVTASQDYAVKQYANANVTFEGAPRVESVFELTGTLSTGTQYQSFQREYLTSDSPTRFTRYGSVSQTVSTGAGTTVITDEREVSTPPASIDFVGGPGSSVTSTETSTTTSTTTVNGVAQPSTTTTSTDTSTFRFVAVETMTVPAGTYTACRLEPSDGNARDATWMIPGTGVSARSDLYDANGKLELRSELLSLTRNGTPL